MKSIKLNKLNQSKLNNDQMNKVLGGEGPTCTCGCCYVHQDGSNTSDNMAANYESHLTTRCPDPIPVYY